MGLLLVLSYFAGLLAAMSVMRARAGAGWWHGMQIFGPEGFGVVFVSKIAILSLLWPVTLAAWLLCGRPEPRVVFNEKAQERRARSLADAG